MKRLFATCIHGFLALLFFLYMGINIEQATASEEINTCLTANQNNSYTYLIQTNHETNIPLFDLNLGD